ncbi:MAG: glycoside hydrolase family 3 N-terminal domain-containing protein [Thermoleophilaceae bacterium]
MTVVALTLLVVLGGALGLQGGGDEASQKATTKPVAKPDPRAGSGAVGGPADPAAVALARMSVQRKVAQVFLWGFTGQGSDASVLGRLRSLDLGGVLISGANYAGQGQLRGLTAELRSAAARARHVQPWVTAAQQGGEFNSLPGLPPATAPADLDGSRAGAREATAAGRALRPLGVNGVLGPVLDVGAADNVAVGARAFSDDADEVAGYAQRTIAAYRRERVFSAPAHFPGLGSASQDPGQGPVNVSLSARELSRRDLVPFRTAVDEGAPGIVVSNGLYVYDDFVTPASLSRKVMVGLLRKRLDFRGIALTDNLTDPAVTALEEPSRAAVVALKAGADMLFISGPAADQDGAYRAVLRAVRKGEIPRRRLDEAVKRILSVKRDYGLLR